METKHKKRVKCPAKSRRGLANLLNNKYGGSPRSMARAMTVSRVTVHKWMNAFKIELVSKYR